MRMDPGLDSTTPDLDGPAHDEPGPGRPLSPTRLVLSTLLAFSVLVGAAGALGYWFRVPLLATGLWFVVTLGGPGIAISFFLADAFALPIPNDAILGLGRAGHMPIGPLVAWAMVGGSTGGCTAWLLGRRLGRTAALRRFVAGRGASLHRSLRRHGVAVVAIAALTPLPDSVAAWAAGSTGLPFAPFFAASLLRIVRIVAALMLIDWGLGWGSLSVT
jgi:membrane protein YqaA with SNARE-associated domain